MQVKRGSKHLKYKVLKGLLPLAVLLLLTFCRQQVALRKAYLDPDCQKERIGEFFYCERDSTSTILISHHECTECLDAQVDSGTVFFPRDVISEIRNIQDQRGNGFIPNGRDLYLTGKKGIAEKLFGGPSDFLKRWHNKYIITGKVVGIKGTGIVFQVNSYRRVE